MGVRHGGRQKGTPNKDKQELLSLIQKRVGDKKYHPVVEMAVQAVELRKSIDEHTTEEELKAADNEVKWGYISLTDKHKLLQMANKEVAQYVAPKLKAVEVSGTGDDGAITVVVRKFSDGG